jgi:hypothetical protein
MRTFILICLMYARSKPGRITLLGTRAISFFTQYPRCGGDDFIALAPDEHDKVSSITDVEIDGIFLTMRSVYSFVVARQGQA